jgi:two-component system, NtrC family, response regulator AtoC
MPRRARVLLAEDDYDVRFALAESLRGMGFDVIAVADGATVKAYVDDCVFLDVPHPRVDVLVTDVRMPRMDGLGLLDYIATVGFDVPSIVITAFGDRDTRMAARECGARVVLDKPIDVDELGRLLETVLRRAS